MITDYQAKYYAYQLTKRCASNNIEKLAASLSDAQVDLNPHQVEAALFAFRSPLSKGALLADEVGLGKTIEAGILLSQKWAERKRKILIIVPSGLRKQWNQELLEKFFLPSCILESKSFNEFIRKGKSNPFDQAQIVICSYHFARNKADYIKQIDWELVVIDEAHRLRNVYKKSNKIAKAIREVILDRSKILLTATPLQNSLLELYGLVSFIDEYTFGDVKSYKSQYARLNEEVNFDELKARLSPICKRTLRRQVLEYIKYTNRIPITQEFVYSDNEQKLYELVLGYLQREKLYALPKSQRQLVTLVLLKLLASSTYAISGTLNSLIERLRLSLKNVDVSPKVEELAEDFESLEEVDDEWAEDEDPEKEDEKLTSADLEAIKAEIKELEAFHNLARSITENAKGKVLQLALRAGLAKARSLGANEKAIIFTESRRTQEYLVSILSQAEYKDRIVLFNGSNSDEKSKEIYQRWVEKYAGTDKITGSKTADMRSALVDYFKESAQIMIATEAAAEGINLQFCSLVVNYDLPWNPQRIEQRIGRCHRYGQKHDVVVVNFLNVNNVADKRVYELLAEKFKLFSGVFGASDEVLGSIDSGVDFEKRIAKIYQECRTEEEIQKSFDQLQKELESQIDETVKSARKRLLENFDEEVHEKLRVNLRESKTYLNKYENWLWEVTKYYLTPYAEFLPGDVKFRLNSNPFSTEGISLGVYRMAKNVEDAHLYRLGHPLAQNIIEAVKERKLNDAEITFHYSKAAAKISILEPFVKTAGYLLAANLAIDSLEPEDHLILCGIADNQNILDEEQCSRLLTLPAEITSNNIAINYRNKLSQILEEKKNMVLDGITQKNTSFFEEEIDKLDKWAEDKRQSLKINLKELDEKIKELKKQSRLSANLPEKIKLQKQIKVYESRRDEAWWNFEKVSREIEGKKDDLIDKVEERLKQTITEEILFTVRWKII